MTISMDVARVNINNKLSSVILKFGCSSDCTFIALKVSFASAGYITPQVKNRAGKKTMVGSPLP